MSLKCMYIHVHAFEHHDTILDKNCKKTLIILHLHQCVFIFLYVYPNPSIHARQRNVRDLFIYIPCKNLYLLLGDGTPVEMTGKEVPLIFSGVPIEYSLLVGV